MFRDVRCSWFYRRPPEFPEVLVEWKAPFHFQIPRTDHAREPEIDQFRSIKIQPKTIDLNTRLWGINPTDSVVIPQSLALRSIVGS